MRCGSLPPWRLQDTDRLWRARPSLPGTGFSQASATAAGGNDLEKPLQSVRPPKSRLAVGTPVFLATVRTARPLAPVFPGLSGATLPAGSPPHLHGGPSATLATPSRGNSWVDPSRRRSSEEWTRFPSILCGRDTRASIIFLKLPSRICLK